MIRPVLAAGLLVLCASATAGAEGRPSLVVGVQESGTVRWEIETIDRLGLAEARGVEIDVRFLADSRAGQVALQTGAVDVILSDFVWVSAQRTAGADFSMVPHSLAVGGLFVPPDSAIASIEDLAGTTIAVAGGPLDKSWVILRALYAARTGEDLLGLVEARYGAPPLVNELLVAGRIDAGLNFWQWNARAEAAGMVELVSVAEMLAELGIADPVPLLGWTFSEAVAGENTEALARFLDASFDAKAVLAGDDTAWVPLANLMGAEDDAALFATLRDAYREGIVGGYDPQATGPAEAAFALIGAAEESGASSETLAPGTFWQGYARAER